MVMAPYPLCFIAIISLQSLLEVYCVIIRSQQQLFLHRQTAHARLCS